MNEIDTKQLGFIYAYLKKKKKKLKLNIKCKVCKNTFHHSEFYTSTKVCKHCWKDYVIKSFIAKGV